LPVDSAPQEVNIRATRTLRPQSNICPGDKEMLRVKRFDDDLESVVGPKDAQPISKANKGDCRLRCRQIFA